MAHDGGQFAQDLHAAYFQQLLDGHAHPAFQGLDSNRMTLLYFAVTALDVLGSLEPLQGPAIVEWVYAQQVLDHHLGGFRGGPAGAGADLPHLASTYTALAILLALGDDLGRVRRDAVLRGVRALQQEDGSFAGFAGGESDMRFVFCAAAVGAMLGDVACACVDRPKAVGYVLASVSYEGGLGLGPGLEAHGGSTYCGLAALSLLGALGDLARPDAAVRWCAQRQVGGFQGRANKDEDTCYSYWIGASLALLGRADLIEARASAAFTRRCQCARGGLCKHEAAPPDPLHSCLSICGLSVAGRPGLEPLEPALGLTRRAWAHALAHGACARALMRPPKCSG